MEMLDLLESQLQSGHCQMFEGVGWTTTNVKFGYLTLFQSGENPEGL